MNKETTPPQQQAEPPPEWPLIKNILDVFGLDAIAFVADWKAAQQKAEPVAWDKPSDNFNAWWDSDLHDNANPFEKDSYAYWAFEGWQAALAQRPWVKLTDEEIMEMMGYDKQYGYIPQYSRNFVEAITAKLMEKNT